MKNDPRGVYARGSFRRVIRSSDIEDDVARIPFIPIVSADLDIIFHLDRVINLSSRLRRSYIPVGPFISEAYIYKFDRSILDRKNNPILPYPNPK